MNAGVLALLTIIGIGATIGVFLTITGLGQGSKSNAILGFIVTVLMAVLLVSYLMMG